MAAHSRFENQGYVNWVCGTMALQCLKEGLEDYVDDQATLFHDSLLQKLGSSFQACTQCTSNDIKKDSQRKRWEMKCTSCKLVLDGIISFNRNVKFPLLCVENTDPSKWSSDPWEVLKLYLPYGYATARCAKDIDSQGILKLFKECSHFKLLLSKDLTDELLAIRNNLIHSGAMEVDEKDLNKYLLKMMDFLQNLKGFSVNQDDQRNDAFNKIDELKNNRLNFSLKEDEDLGVLMFRKREAQLAKIDIDNEFASVKARLDTLEKEKGNKDLDVELLKVDLGSIEERLKQCQESTGHFEKFVAENGLAQKLSMHDSVLKYQEREIENLQKTVTEQRQLIKGMVQMIKYVLAKLNPGLTDTLTIPELVLVLRVIGSDKNDGKEAENSLREHFQIDEINSKDAPDDAKAVAARKFLNITNNCHSKYLGCTEGSILLHFQCKNVQGLLEFLEMFLEGKYQISLDGIEKALNAQCNSNYRVAFQITDDCLMSVCRWIFEFCCQISGQNSAPDAANWKSIPLQCNTLDAVANAASRLKYHWKKESAEEAEFNVVGFVAAFFNANRYLLEDGIMETSNLSPDTEVSPDVTLGHNEDKISERAKTENNAVSNEVSRERGVINDTEKNLKRYEEPLLPFDKDDSCGYHSKETLNEQEKIAKQDQERHDEDPKLEKEQPKVNYSDSDESYDIEKGIHIKRLSPKRWRSAPDIAPMLREQFKGKASHSEPIRHRSQTERHRVNPIMVQGKGFAQ